MNTTTLKRTLYSLLGHTPATMPMVRYWKTKESVKAKILYNKDGTQVMKMEGEDYEFPGFPRGHILFGKLSKLKHEIKNQIFNESWAQLEAGTEPKEVVDSIVKKLKGIYAISDEMRYDRVPPEHMSPAVREIHRAWTKVSPETGELRDMLCMILQEDDAYRFRVQWVAGWFSLLRPLVSFEKALSLLEHAEVVLDMKERQRLLKRILLTFVNDTRVKPLFIKLFKEIDWKKVRLSAGDKYHFRGKYFKVDLDKFEY